MASKRRMKGVRNRGKLWRREGRGRPRSQTRRLPAGLMPWWLGLLGLSLLGDATRR